MIKESDEEFPGFTTPIDELLKKFQEEGLMVVFGKHPESGNIFTIPAKTGNIEDDNIFPRYLISSEISDERLKKLSRDRKSVV